MVLDLIDVDFFRTLVVEPVEVIIFRLNMSSSRKIDSRKKKDILIARNGPRQGLEHTLSTKKRMQLILLKIIKRYV